MRCTYWFVLARETDVADDEGKKRARGPKACPPRTCAEPEPEDELGTAISSDRIEV